VTGELASFGSERVTASVYVDAKPEVVYEFFTRAEEMVRWMGQFARLDPRPGGELSIDINGAAVRGRYRELDPPHRVVFTWGVAGSDELPPDGSTVEVLLTAEAGGTLVEVVHSGLPEPERAKHARGWRHFLDLLAVSPSRTFNVSSFAGQTVTLTFKGVEDSSLQTSFVIDDTALNVS
jgi:uncharacterized protein YndB with AHSA1/START domain